MDTKTSRTTDIPEDVLGVFISGEVVCPRGEKKAFFLPTQREFDFYMNG